jgi:phosphate uptake regulator
VIVVPRESLDTLWADLEPMAKSMLGHLSRAPERDERGRLRGLVEGDERSNLPSLEPELDCIYLSARQQPVAPDLRLVAAPFEILTDLKRMGYLVRNARAGSSGVITKSRIQTSDESTRSPGKEAVNIYVDADPELGC